MNDETLMLEIERRERIRKAAPDMLAALKSLVENDGRIQGVNLGALAKMVHAAIAKAEDKA